MLWSRPSGPCDGRLPAELAAEQHQRLVEQAALLQVGEQRRGRLVDAAAAVDQPLVQVVVVVPARLADLDEAHARLAQPAGHQALPGERRRPGRASRRRRRSTFCGSFEMSSSSGTLPCIRNASS